MRKSILTFDLFFVASTFVCLRGGVSFHFIVLIAFWIIGKATHSPVGAFYYEHRLFFFPLSRRWNRAVMDTKRQIVESLFTRNTLYNIVTRMTTTE